MANPLVSRPRVRDALLVVLGVLSVHVFYQVVGTTAPHRDSITVNTNIKFTHENADSETIVHGGAGSAHGGGGGGVSDSNDLEEPPRNGESYTAFQASHTATGALPQTSVLSHAPGWTVFQNVYMSNGTIYIVSPDAAESFPDIKYITSTGLEAENTPENIAARMPTSANMAFITPAQAHERWGVGEGDERRNRVWTVLGNTLVFNDPPQFLNHYYHFCAELFFGVWMTWVGTFPSAKLDVPTTLPHRAIFPHSPTSGWRDEHGFNGLFIRAVLPSLTIEVHDDWQDRVLSTRDGSRAWHFPTMLFVDRSAAFRGFVTDNVHRTAASTYYPLARAGRLLNGWWEPIRRAVLVFSGSPDELLDLADHAPALGTGLLGPTDARLQPGLEAGNKFARLTDGDGEWDEGAWATLMEEEARQRADLAEGIGGGPAHAHAHIGAHEEAAQRGDAERVVITYISRQGTRRHLVQANHDALVAALEDVCGRRGWELHVAQFELMTKEEQFILSARTTIMLGVHGNGLTHLILMAPRAHSTVIEIFYPEGFAHDYEWTTRALGMKHYAVWNDTSLTWPDTPWVAYPEGFQGTEIPVHAPYIIEIIEGRVDGHL